MTLVTFLRAQYPQFLLETRIHDEYIVATGEQIAERLETLGYGDLDETEGRVYGDRLFWKAR